MIASSSLTKSLDVSSADAGSSVVLCDVSWEMYEKILDAFADRRLRHTYIDGTLEIMSPLRVHEWRKSLIGRLIEMLAWKLRIPIDCAGSTTLRLKLRRRGLEPDESYYVANEPIIRGRDDLDLRKDPPPDLAVEVDVTHKSLNRLEAYAKLGVPEIWRHDGQTMQFLKLDSRRKYVPIKKSLSFPGIGPADIQRYVHMLTTNDQNSIIDAFVAWLDKTFPPKK